MIGKNEKVENDNTNTTRINIINEKRKLLQDTSAKVQEEVRLCFERLAKVLRTREQRLLRQVQAVHNQQLLIIQSNWELLPNVPSIKVNLSDQQDLEDSIINFGELLSSDRNSIIVNDAEPYKIEEYVEANKDHISFDKSIKIDMEEETIVAAERLDNVMDCLYELSFDTSSEADITLENEITVLMNHNYSSSSDGLEENHDSPELLIEQAVEKKNSSNEFNVYFNEDSSKIANNVLNHSEETELEVSGEAIRVDGDRTAPDGKKNPIAEELESFTKENDSSENENKDSYSSTDSGSPAEASEKNSDPMLNKKTQDCDQHPKQIQQWLRQILVETETEPTIHEVEQFAEISKSRFKEFQFPLET